MLGDILVRNIVSPGQGFVYAFFFRIQRYSPRQLTRLSRCYSRTSSLGPAWPGRYALASGIHPAFSLNYGVGNPSCFLARRGWFLKNSVLGQHFTCTHNAADRSRCITHRHCIIALQRLGRTYGWMDWWGLVYFACVALWLKSCALVCALDFDFWLKLKLTC